VCRASFMLGCSDVSKLGRVPAEPRDDPLQPCTSPRSTYLHSAEKPSLAHLPIKMASLTNQLQETPRLLSLPKELRLEIWRYTLTDPSIDAPVLLIRRKCLHCGYKNYPVCTPPHCKSTTATYETEIKFETPKPTPFGVNVLRTNRFIYEETLPILYHHVKFFPVDKAGILQSFLEKLSPFARSHIRHVVLSMSGIGPFCTGFGSTYWPHQRTCTQVGQLGGLRSLQIIGTMSTPLSADPRGKRWLLRPLLKINAPITFDAYEDARVQELLREEKREMEAEIEQYETITVQDQYRDWSLEELRVADYQHGPRYG
jgi:hypothetical protein